MEKILLENIVIFSPSDRTLTPLGLRGKETLMNTPVSRFLLLLLHNHGEVVSQEKIFKEVWEKHGQLVTANTLYQNVSLLRKNLRSAGILHSTVKTIPKIGFTFIGAVDFIEKEEKIADPILLEELSDDNTETPPEKAIPEKNSWIKSLNLKIIIPALFFLVLAIIIYFSLIASPIHREQLVYAHNKIARINDCNVYVDNNNFKANWDKYVGLLKDKEFTCSSNEFMYLTKVQEANKDVFAMICSSETDKGLRCVTRYKIIENSIATISE